MDQVDSGDTDRIVVGAITGHFGVKGWVKVKSYTRPEKELLNYQNWTLTEWDKRTGLVKSMEVCRLIESRQQGRSLIAKLESVDSRELAERFLGRQIEVARQDLPVLEAGEYYWEDLVGLEVMTSDGRLLGKVDHLLETGANDVMVLKAVDEAGEPVEYLVPWLPQVVLKVDLQLGTMQVEWETDY